MISKQTNSFTFEQVIDRVKGSDDLTHIWISMKIIQIFIKN